METQSDITLIEKELDEYDCDNSWNIIFQRLKNEATILAQDVSTTIARSADNRARNRYRDVSPYDHSRICLNGVPDNDYINASLVPVECAGRSYILTQGPLPSTAGHFWLMVWEQRSPSVIMLNRLIEKGVLKCFPYYPEDMEDEPKHYPEVGLRVTCLDIDDYGFYIKRTIQLDNLLTATSRTVLQFHYLTWPDFGVPRSPGAFLNFLWAVRRSGALSGSAQSTDLEPGPSVIHCSAGIGRSGTFALVDSCLVLISERGDLSGVSVHDLLLNMRRHRMGLIQTAEQLRFSYLAVIEGGKTLLACNPLLREEIEFSMSEEDRLAPLEPAMDSESTSSGSEIDEIIPLDSESDDDMEQGATGWSGGDWQTEGRWEWEEETEEQRMQRNTSNPDELPMDTDLGSPVCQYENPGMQVEYPGTKVDYPDTQVTNSSAHVQHPGTQVENPDTHDNMQDHEHQTHRRERVERTRAQLDKIKTRMHEQELMREKWYYRLTHAIPLPYAVGAVIAVVAVAGVALYRFW